MEFCGRAWKLGDDIDTDAIIPARYLNTTEACVLAKHCLENIDPHFASRVKQGDILVAGKNFGCGSSREHAPLALVAAGISCVIAASFARIFFRNSLNIGLPIFESPEAAAGIAPGDLVRVRAAAGAIENLTRAEKYQAVPFPPFMQELIKAGGLIPYVAQKLKAQN